MVMISKLLTIPVQNLDPSPSVRISIYSYSLDQQNEEALRSAIVESWPFADSARTAQFIEIAKNASLLMLRRTLIAVILLARFIKFLAFRQKHSYSKTFGTCLDFFSLCYIGESR